MQLLDSSIMTHSIRVKIRHSKKAKNPVVDNFDMAKTELKKYSIEARENVRFLSTLERHFKERGNQTDSIYRLSLDRWNIK